MAFLASVLCWGSGAGAQESAPGDKIYRWTDASGEEHFTNDVKTIPEPLRSKYLQQDAAEKAKRPKPAEKPREPAKQAEPAKPAGPSVKEPETRPAFKDHSPPDTREEDAAAKAREEAIKTARSRLVELTALLKKKTDEMNLAAGWETILQIPKYKQDKLRLLGEIDKIKAEIKDTEKKLEELGRPVP